MGVGEPLKLVFIEIFVPTSRLAPCTYIVVETLGRLNVAPTSITESMRGGGNLWGAPRGRGMSSAPGIIGIVNVTVFDRPFLFSSATAWVVPGIASSGTENMKAP